MEVNLQRTTPVYAGQEQPSGTEAPLYEDIARNLPIRAGIRSGMRVLDAGCGAGRLSLIAAELTVTSREILVFDISARALAKAKQSALDLDIQNIKFVMLPLIVASVRKNQVRR